MRNYKKNQEIYDSDCVCVGSVPPDEIEADSEIGSGSGHGRRFRDHRAHRQTPQTRSSARLGCEGFLFIVTVFIKYGIFFFANVTILKNKAGYTATEVACGWAGAIFEATPLFRQEQ